MKIVDEKGRLFGKINLVDLIVVLVLVAAVAAVAWKVVGSKIAASKAPEAPVYEYRVLCSQVYPEVSDFAQTCIGDQLLTNDGRLDGEIVDVVSTPHISSSLDNTGDGPVLDAPDLRDLVFTIRCRVKVKEDGVYLVGNQEIRVGKVHLVKSTKLEIANGIILSVESVSGDA